MTERDFKVLEKASVKLQASGSSRRFQKVSSKLSSLDSNDETSLRRPLAVLPRPTNDRYRRFFQSRKGIARRW